LPLTDALFDEGAMMFDTLASRSIWFGQTGSSGIAVGFGGVPFRGVASDH
jgi:hypothetical protein